MTIESAMIKAIRKFNKRKLGSIRELYPLEWTGANRNCSKVLFQITYIENNSDEYKSIYEYVIKGE